jgi:trimeric autotransporter adhesin
MYAVPIAGQTINTAQIGIETNISSSSASIGNLSVVNATIGQLSTTIFNPASVTTTTLDATTGVLDSLIVNNSITELNVVQLNVSQKNVSNLSAINISAEEITCNNLQPLLTAGTNISILDGVISAINEALLPEDVNFDSVTALYIDANNVSLDNLSIDENLNVGGNVNISGSLSASNLSTGSLKFGNGLSYDTLDQQLEVNVDAVIQSGSTLPITSGAVYNAINTQSTSLIHTVAYTLFETAYFKYDNLTAAPGETNLIFYLDYYTQYGSGSKITVDFCYSYWVTGFRTDTVYTIIEIGRNNNTTQEEVQVLAQSWTDDAGGGTRSGASGSISATYTNTDTSGKYHRIKMKIQNGSSDDTWNLGNLTYPMIRVTEYLPISGISNPNIRIGSGNISCGNISCTALSVTDLTIDNVITNYNVNVGGDMITVGFPISGVIPSKSVVRLAGGNVLLNYGDLTWDGTTFNVSTRQSNKNFKVSFAQQDYFEVNSNNTSCRSLYVNGNISMSGTLTIGGALLFTSAIIQDSLLVNGLITGSSAEFSDNVTFDDNVSMHRRLNVSNLSVTLGLTVYGNISTRGNISANSIYAPNLSTASLKAGTNITIIDGFINAYVEGGTLVDCGSLQVDTDANIFGILNVSKTSTFVESLNVCNIIYAGKTGQHDGSVVVYSQSIGNNWASKFDGSILNMSATGTTSQVNTWLGENKMLSITPTGVNICGTLKADFIDADYTNFSTVNLSVQNATVGLLTVENTSGINASFNQLSGSIIDVTQLNGTNGHFTSSLTAANISTGSLVFGSGLTFFLGELSVDFTTSETQIANFQNSLAQEVVTNTLDVGLGTINVLTVTTFMNTCEINASVINCSDIDSNSGTIDVLDCTNISTDVLDVNTSINACHLNCSTLNIVDTIGAGGLNVSGAAYFDFLFAYNPCYFETNDVYFGKPEATGTNARLNFWSQITPVEVGLRFGIDTDDIVRMNIPTSGGSTTYNILMGNVSTMTMTNTSTRFHQQVIMTNLSVPNISSTRANFTTDIITPKVTTEALNTSSTMLFNLLNVPSMELSDSLYLYTDLRGTNLYSSENVCGNNASFTNLSTTNLTVTNFSSPALTTANMSIGNGLNFSNNILTGTSSLTAGNNLQIVADVISTSTNINVSNLSSVKLVVNTSISSRHINCSTINVCGLATFDSLLVSGPGATGLLVDEVAVGKVGGSRSVVTFWDDNEVGFRVGLEADGFARLAVPYYGQFVKFNINLSNISYLTMENNSTRFQRNVIFGNDVTATKITCTNICNTNLTSTKITCTNISNTNLSTTNCTITTLRGTTLSGNTINASNLNISTKLSVTNISATNITATSITAPNVQPTLTAGTNIAIVGNVISSSGGGTNYTEGNNIQIVGDVISTTANLNSSNISSINGSFTNLTCSGSVNSNTVNSSTLNSSNITINTKVTTTNLSATTATINTSLSANYIYTNTMTVGGLLTTGFFESEDFFTGDLTSSGIIFGNEIRATIVKSATLNGTSINCSSINCSLTISTTNLCATSITATSIVAPDVQPTLTTSNNIQIVADTISTTDIITSSTHNVSTINTSNISASQMSLTGDLTMGGYVNRKNSFLRFYRASTSTFAANEISFITTFPTAQFTNTNLLTTASSNSIYTTVKTGIYKLTALIGVSNGTYTDRVNWRIRLFVNGSYQAKQSQAFCYTRHRDYAEYGSMFSSVIIDLDAGDTFYWFIDCNRASNTGFVSGIGGSQVLSGSFSEIEFLGV